MTNTPLAALARRGRRAKDAEPKRPWVLRRFKLYREDDVIEALADLMAARGAWGKDYISDKQFVQAAQRARGET